jgi:hypothetical protein
MTLLPLLPLPTQLQSDDVAAAATTAVIANATTSGRTLVIQDPPGLSATAGSNANNSTLPPLLASSVGYGSASFFPLSVLLSATVPNIVASDHS